MDFTPYTLTTSYYLNNKTFQTKKQSIFPNHNFCSLVDIFSSYFWIVDFSSNFKLHYDTFFKLFCFQHLLAFYYFTGCPIKFWKYVKIRQIAIIILIFLKWPKNFHVKSIQFLNYNFSVKLTIFFKILKNLLGHQVEAKGPFFSLCSNTCLLDKMSASFFFTLFYSLFFTFPTFAWPQTSYYPEAKIPCESHQKLRKNGQTKWPLITFIFVSLPTSGCESI